MNWILALANVLAGVQFEGVEFVTCDWCDGIFDPETNDLVYGEVTECRPCQEEASAAYYEPWEGVKKHEA